jgi:ABC-type multidrug transport system fused ATPase/permease subunit
VLLVRRQALPESRVRQRRIFGRVSSMHSSRSIENLTQLSVLLSVMTMIAHLSAISVPLTAASNALNAASIFFKIIDAPKPNTAGLQGADVPMDCDIELKNVNFAYPSRHDVRVLEDFSLRLKSGHTTAIVGPSGSGKSEFVRVVEFMRAVADRLCHMRRYRSRTHIQMVRAWRQRCHC